MPKSLFFSFLLPLLYICSPSAFAQEKTPSFALITQEVKEAKILMKAGSFEKSLVQSRLALRHAIAIKDDNLIASSYHTIAANFDELSEYEKAFYYYNKGLIYANKTNNDVLKNWIYNNLGNIYCFDKKQYEKGIFYYKKSLAYSKKINDPSQVVFTKLNIAWAYFDIGQFGKGYPYLKHINLHHKKYGDSSTIVALNMLNGMYYSYKNDTKKAHSFFQNAIKLGNEGTEKSDLSYSHQEYSKFLLKNGDYKKAYENLDIYNALTSALNDEEKLKKVNVAGINLEIDEYKREIEKIESEYKSKQRILLREQALNKRIVIVVISLFIVSIILFYFLFQNTNLKQKNRLNSIKSKIQQNVINASITGQEMERKKIATFLHDNISALLSSAGLHLNVFATNTKNGCQEISKTIALLEEAHDKVRDLSHELLPVLLARFGLLYALQDLCEKNSNSNILFEYESDIAITKRYSEEFEMKIYFITTELLNNIIKHSEATLAKVIIKEQNSLLHIQVYDNGNGFDTNLNHIEGFGITQIRARVDTMKGLFFINSKVGTGTTITIDVPIFES
ncbi:tetratricopeptide repeat-containing sensor histidine kinase [Flavobacterium lacustre]|uniref:tetratricopeptide repeat-containing sensor histidine kinase n=1 Tax=Flavobacterium lacustre TaxID=3016339 RepID=UPI0022B6E7FE|nr:tetratricopeptide repeat-containing sensor histidine kinase [Flavobacterium lacustre]